VVGPGYLVFIGIVFDVVCICLQLLCDGIDNSALRSVSSRLQSVTLASVTLVFTGLRLSCKLTDRCSTIAALNAAPFLSPNFILHKVVISPPRCSCILWKWDCYTVHSTAIRCRPNTRRLVAMSWSYPGEIWRNAIPCLQYYFCRAWRAASHITLSLTVLLKRIWEEGNRCRLMVKINCTFFYFAKE